MPKVALMGGPVIDVSSAASAAADVTGLPVVSPGNVWREYVNLRMPLGEEMGLHIQAGGIVPDELITKAIADALAKVDGGWVLCNYPRRIGQAELLARAGHAPDTVIELVLTGDELGLAVRRRVERRIELEPELAARREELLLRYLRGQEDYQDQVEPLRAYYRTRAMLRTVNGFGYYEDVAAMLIPFVSGGQVHP